MYFGLKSYFFDKRFHFSRFEFNLVGLLFITIGLITGTYLTLSKVFPNIFAVNDTYKTWTFDSASASGFTYDSGAISIGDSGGSLINKIVNSGFETDLSSWSEVPSYILNDQFTTDRAAGAVNGTSAEPTGGVRTVADTQNKMTIGSGVLNFSSGKTSTAYGDPAIWYGSMTRVPGLLLISTVTPSTTDKYFRVGWDNNQSGGIDSNHLFFDANGKIDVDPYGSNIDLTAFSAGTQYQTAIVLRSAGAYFFIKGGIFMNWSLLYSTVTPSNSTVYPNITNYSAALTADNIRIPTSTWLPTPLAYSTFTTDSATSTETTGPDSQTTPALALTGGTVAGGKLTITPTTLGIEDITNGNMETGSPPSSWTANSSSLTSVADERTGGSGTNSLSVTVSGAPSLGDATQTLDTANGNWVQVNGWVRNISGTPGASIKLYVNGDYGGVVSSTSSNWTYLTATGLMGSSKRILLQGNNVNGQETRFDDISAKPLTLSELFSTVTTSTTDVIVDVNVTSSTNAQAGIVTNLDSTTNPTFGLVAYLENKYGTRYVRLDKFTTPTTWTNLITGAITYVPDATLRVITYHSDANTLKVRVYYNNAMVGTEQTISDVGIISNTKHGMFSTYSGNTFDNFTIFPRNTNFSDAPFEELTVTRDTGTKYSGNASVKLVAGGTDGNYLQSVNVGNGNSYIISAYAYKASGQAITTSDLNLFYDGSVQNTTFTSVGGDWYKLTATVSGSNTAKDFGVRVKAGKTIYVDSFGVINAENNVIYNTTAYTNSDLTRYDSFASVEVVPTGSSIGYQIATDVGSTTWQYYNGTNWVNSTNVTSDFNSVSQLTQSVMQLLPTDSKKIAIKTILITDGVALPSIKSVTVGMTTDITPPPVNGHNILMYKSTSGAEIGTSGWTSGLAPRFEWDDGVDDEGGSGIKGYCLYLGNSASGNPATAKGLLGTSPVSIADSTCQFIVADPVIDFATLAYRGETWLTTSSSPYYLNVKAIDNAGNIYGDIDASFPFYFDSVVPTNVSYISCASGNFSNVADMNFNWPTSSGVGASDANSQIAGYQYQINSLEGSWKSLPLVTTYNLVGGTDSASIVSGNNVIYFRSIDTAGNISIDSTIRTCSLSYGGAAPDFGGSDNITVTPSVNTANSFALSWPEATATIGKTVTHYYYMVNTPPPSTLATLQGNSTTYVDVGTSLTVSSQALAGVNKGTNTVYVVAVDNAATPNYSPSNYITGTFTLNSTDPDNVGNLVASDSSIKATSSWNVTLTWTAPTYAGAGNLTYLIHRSTDGITFAQSGTTSGLSYVDNTPSSAQYYYKVYSKDGANAQSSGTNAVSITPTGKWTTSPSLDSGPSVGSITTKKATITWGTSRSSDSKVAYGTESGKYSSDEVSNSSQTSSHSVNLTNLKAGTNYYYKAKWTDEDGNTGESEEKSFSTISAPTVKDVSAKSIGLESAIIEFTSNNASKIKIYYGATTAFGGLKEISTSTSETTYTSELTGLLDGTKYYYKLNKYDSDGSEYEGDTYIFETLPRPKISGVKLEQVANTAQTTIRVSWNSNTEISSIVSYAPETDTGNARDEVKVALEKGAHSMILRNLLPQTKYLLVVKGRDKAGNEARSDSQRFTTATDTRPPQVLNLKVLGGTIPPVGFAAGEVKAQLIITWDTDELSTSQVEFGQGTGINYSQKSQEDGNLTTNHTVILSNLIPSQVYHLRAISSDSAGNETRSIDNVTIAPKATKSALDLVMRNLSEVFSFVNYGK